MKSVVASAVLILAALPCVALAQCPARWLPGDPLSGVTLPDVSGLAEWDPDGSGPQPSVVVAAGSFVFAGRTSASGVATWNEQDSEWQPVPGLFRTVSSPTSIRSISVQLVADGRKALVVTGFMALTLGGETIYVARFTESGWSALDVVGQPVGSVALPDGRVAIGGRIARSGQPLDNRVFILDGQDLNEAVGLPTIQSIRTLTTLSGGEVVIAAFTGANQPDLILRWNGATWQSLGSPLRFVSALVGGPGGALYATGSPGPGGLAITRVVRWDESAWQRVGADFTSGAILTLAVQPDGQLIAAGISSGVSSAFRGVMRWDGSRWIDLGATTDAAVRAVLPRGNGRLVVGGAFTTISNIGSSGVARLQDGAWKSFTPGLNGDVTAAEFDGNGTVILGGPFTGHGGGLAQQVVRWNGRSYSPLETGLNGSVSVIRRTSAGAILVGGGFYVPSVFGTSNIARWTGSRWESLGTGLGSLSTFNNVTAIEELADGSIVAGGYFNSPGSPQVPNPARWNGSSWQPLGGGVNGDIHALKQLPDGRLVVGGSFTRAGGVVAQNIAIWNGATWQAVGDGVDSIVFDIELTTGGFVACGGFQNAGDTPVSFIARWDGTNWHPLASGFSSQLFSLASLPDGRLLAVGVPVGSTRVNRGVFVWDGGSWSEIPGELDGGIVGIATNPSGDIVAFGRSLSVGAQDSYGAVLYSTRRICSGDFNCSDTLTTSDLIEYLNAWFTRSPAANVDSNPEINNVDLTSFLSNWFAGC